MVSGREDFSLGPQLVQNAERNDPMSAIKKKKSLFIQPCLSWDLVRWIEKRSHLGTEMKEDGENPILGFVAFEFQLQRRWSV
jgi:hypothetical protein